MQKVANVSPAGCKHKVSSPGLPGLVMVVVIAGNVQIEFGCLSGGLHWRWEGDRKVASCARLLVTRYRIHSTGYIVQDT